MSTDNKEIQVLEDWEHVMLRPQVYVSSVNMSEQKVPIIRDGKIVQETRTISVGFYKLLNEILDNAVDEAKRMKGKMPSISVKIDSKTNACQITDTGDGFYRAGAINKKSGKSNVETAMSQLKAGSNFKNEETESTIVGMNGMGAALVNILSDEFFVDTQNSEEHYRQEWDKFQTTGGKTTKGLKRQTGTIVGFRPRKGVFRGCSWDKDMIFTIMSFKHFLLKQDTMLKALDFSVEYDGELLDLNNTFIPKDAHVIKSRLGVLAIYPVFDSSTSVSFVNSAMCSGIHQKVINEFINAELEDPLGHHFYESFFVLNMAPRLISFADQNKTRLDSERKDVQGPILDAFRSGLESMFSTPMFAEIRKKVEERKMGAEVSKLRKAKKNVQIKMSTKYLPPSGHPENVYICEGDCLDENTEIITINGFNHITKQLKDIKVGDYVVTHNFNIKQVTDINSRVSDAIKVTSKYGDFIVAPKHKMFVYEISSNKYKFINVSEINKADHKLVRSKISNEFSFDEVLSVMPNNDEKYTIRIQTELTVLDSTATHKFCCFDGFEFLMLQADEIKSGHFLASINIG